MKSYRVQVPADLGSVIPEIASIRDDFPALCWPMTAIWGMSMSTWTLQQWRPMSYLSKKEKRKERISDPVLCSRFTKSSIRRRPWESWGSDNPTPVWRNSSSEDIVQVRLLGACVSMRCQWRRLNKGTNLSRYCASENPSKRILVVRFYIAVDEYCFYSWPCHVSLLWLFTTQASGFNKEIGIHNRVPLRIQCLQTLFIIRVNNMLLTCY